MVSDLFVYQLILLALVWLCLMLHYAWPSDRPAAYHRPPQSVLLPRKRSSEPKPFVGLTHTPSWAACEQAAQAPMVQPPPAPSPPITSPRGRRRQVDTSWHCCPHAHWAYWGWVGRGNSCANGHPSGGPWRQLHGTGCGSYFQETHGTL